MEKVNHPSHYQSKNGLEVIDVMAAFTADLTGIEAVDTSNVIKYICRWKKKNGIEDLKKAAWYLDHLIEHVESTQSYDNVRRATDRYVNDILSGEQFANINKKENE
jgi:hypothetical protein